MQQNRALTPAEAAEYIGFSTSTLAKLRLRGTGPAYSKICGRIRYRQNDLDAFLESGRRRSTSAPQREPER